MKAENAEEHICHICSPVRRIRVWAVVLGVPKCGWVTKARAAQSAKVHGAGMVCMSRVRAPELEDEFEFEFEGR
jgi:hypothetical protein